MMLTEERTRRNIWPDYMIALIAFSWPEWCRPFIVSPPLGVIYPSRYMEKEGRKKSVEENQFFLGKHSLAARNHGEYIAVGASSWQQIAPVHSDLISLFCHQNASSPFSRYDDDISVKSSGNLHEMGFDHSRPVPPTKSFDIPPPPSERAQVQAKGFLPRKTGAYMHDANLLNYIIMLACTNIPVRIRSFRACARIDRFPSREGKVQSITDSFNILHGLPCTRSMQAVRARARNHTRRNRIVLVHHSTRPSSLHLFGPPLIMTGDMTSVLSLWPSTFPRLI